ncbi:hypothetical protein HPP92_025003 [Vanilla planifolia]|uniref:Uncharacterized protein n=1 Tax=Vanilla planifolia TaxID=51239 RepID=A0A835PI96_VANPL|nr:hypothetical protein HPP92_025003 [Vanilla planifolia]
MLSSSCCSPSFSTKEQRPAMSPLRDQHHTQETPKLQRISQSFPCMEPPQEASILRASRIFPSQQLLSKQFCKHKRLTCEIGHMQNVRGGAAGGAQLQRSGSRACSSARNAAQHASVCRRGRMGTSSSAPVMTTGRQREGALSVPEPSLPHPHNA